MAVHLVVHTPFGEYQRGDRITDPDKVEKALASEAEDFVTKTTAPAEEHDEQAGDKAAPALPAPQAAQEG